MAATSTISSVATYRLREYLAYKAISSAWRDNTSVSIVVTADPASMYIRGNGKTSYALRSAAAWYYFSGRASSEREAWRMALDSVAFSLDEFMEKLNTSSRWQVVIADDAGRWIPRKNSYTAEEQALLEALETFRLDVVAIIWTAVTPRSLPTRIMLASEWLFYVSRVGVMHYSSKAEAWRALYEKDRPYRDPRFTYVTEERFPTFYPAEIHDEYNRRRKERFKHGVGY